MRDNEQQDFTHFHGATSPNGKKSRSEVKITSVKLVPRKPPQSMLANKRVAILYQALIPPMRNGVIKPMKPGGYSDSGADIACSLQQKKITVVTPKDNPDLKCDFDWVFPDTNEGINEAVVKGANVLWLNTILYEGHAVEKFIDEGIEVVGQIPKYVDKHDDKLVTNDLLKSHNLPIPKTICLKLTDLDNLIIDMLYPVVLKPIRGRGSQGVQVIQDLEEFRKQLQDMFDSRQYGDSVYVEEFLPGQEITVTVMPPGNYIVNQKNVIKADYWCLPAVKRFNHLNGIAPYNGIVAVVNNSVVLHDEELNSHKIKCVEKQCELAAKLVHAKAPIRIDCRQNVHNEYFIFDLNMKPNNTGPSRPHRQDQDSLSVIAARKIGWNYADFLTNCLFQSWKKPA